MPVFSRIFEHRKNVLRAFLRKFAQMHQVLCRFGYGTKFQNGRLSVHSKKIWTTSNIRRNGWMGPGNNFAKPQKTYNKNRSGNADASNDSLAWDKEMLMSDTLQTAARSRQTKKKQTSNNINFLTTPTHTHIAENLHFAVSFAIISTVSRNILPTSLLRSLHLFDCDHLGLPLVNSFLNERLL